MERGAGKEDPGLGWSWALRLRQTSKVECLLERAPADLCPQTCGDIGGWGPDPPPDGQLLWGHHGGHGAAGHHPLGKPLPGVIKQGSQPLSGGHRHTLSLEVCPEIRGGRPRPTSQTPTLGPLLSRCESLSSRLDPGLCRKGIRSSL